jgi:hypothetical protein
MCCRLEALKRGAILADVLSRAPEQLPAVRFAQPEHPGDLRVRVVEDFAEQEHGALDRRQALEEQQHRHRYRFIDLRNSRHIASWFGDDWLRQPLADVGFALDARGLQMIDAQAADDRDEERLRRPHLGLGRALPSDERVLEHVLRVGDAAEHAVRNRKQQAAMPLERRRPGRLVWSVHQAVFLRTRTPAAALPSRSRNNM